MFSEDQVIERIDPISWEEARSNYIVRQHSNRYIWAVEKIESWDNVIDVACGVGYGTYYLASNTVGMVFGVDRDKGAIAHAREHFDRGNISWVLGDANKLELTNIANAIVCFETIEHIEDDKTFVELLFDWLTEGGQLLISAPNENKIPLNKWPNPYHYRHYTPDSLKAILEPYFEIVETKFQNRQGEFKDDEDMIIVMYCQKKGE